MAHGKKSKINKRSPMFIPESRVLCSQLFMCFYDELFSAFYDISMSSQFVRNPFHKVWAEQKKIIDQKYVKENWIQQLQDYILKSWLCL